MTKPVVTIEDVSKLHITRRNVPGQKGLILLLIGGVAVGEAKATYVTDSQRYWDAKLDADVNGESFDLKMDHVFSATRITKSFQEAIQHKLSEGSSGRTLEDALKEHGGYKAPKPEAPKSEEVPPAAGAATDPGSAASEKAPEASPEKGKRSNKKDKTETPA